MSQWIKSLSVPIQMKAAEQYFPVVLFINKVVYLLSLWMKSESVTIQIKATEQQFPVWCCYYAVYGALNFESVLPDG